MTETRNEKKGDMCGVVGSSAWTHGKLRLDSGSAALKLEEVALPELPGQTSSGSEVKLTRPAVQYLRSTVSPAAPEDLRHWSCST